MLPSSAHRYTTVAGNVRNLWSLTEHPNGPYIDDQTEWYDTTHTVVMLFA